MQECKKKKAEMKCGCRDTMDRFPDNSTLKVCDVLGTICTLKVRGGYNYLNSFFEHNSDMRTLKDIPGSLQN